MTHPDRDGRDGRDIGRLLDTLVPDLAAPPDRLAAVGRRVRRRRRLTGALAAVVVAVVLVGGAAVLATARGATGPTPSGPAPGVPGAGDCPAGPPLFDGHNDGLPSTAPGDLAPRGAVRAVLCRYNPVPEAHMRRPGPPRQLVLTRDVAGLVTDLNALPAESGLDPCFLGGDGGGYLTLGYGDGTTATIDIANGCGFVRRAAITRYDGWMVAEAFDRRFTAQELAVAEPARVAAAGCAERLTTGSENARYSPDPVSDVWVYTYQEQARYLPVPLAVVTACRYVRAGDAWDRTRRVTDRGIAGDTAKAVDAAQRTTSGELPYLDCHTPPKTVDVLVLRDVLGETREVRVTRDACPVVTFDFDGAPRSAGLDAVLDRLLGRPA